AYLEEHAPPLPALDAVERVMADPYRTLIVAGRLNTQLWGLATRDVFFGKRLFVEEQGMRASGRQERGEVRSLLAILLREVGPAREDGQGRRGAGPRRLTGGDGHADARDGLMGHHEFRFGPRRGGDGISPGRWRSRG